MIIYEPYIAKNGKYCIKIYSDCGYKLRSNTTGIEYSSVSILASKSEDEYFTELVDEPVEIEELTTEESIPENEKKYILTEEQYESLIGRIQALESQSHLLQSPQQNDNESIRLLNLLLGVE